jgi:anti-sigma B factor antagonist
MAGTPRQPQPRVSAPLVAHLSRQEDVMLVRLFGELDLATVPRAEAAIEEAEQHAGMGIEIDLSGLEFMDSTGLRMLLRARERADDGQRTLQLRPGPRAVQRIFDLTSTAVLFEFLI